MKEDLEKLGTSKVQVFHLAYFKNRCWAANYLARCGLPHSSCCPLCDQEEEIIQHIQTITVSLPSGADRQRLSQRDEERAKPYDDPHNLGVVEASR